MVRILVSGRIHENAHHLARHELADDPAICPLDRRELSRPIARAVWPADPRGVVWLPLGGHAEALRGGRGAIGHQPSAISGRWVLADGRQSTEHYRGSGWRSRHTRRCADHAGTAIRRAPPRCGRGRPPRPRTPPRPAGLPRSPPLTDPPGTTCPRTRFRPPSRPP